MYRPFLWGGRGWKYWVQSHLTTGRGGDNGGSQRRKDGEEETRRNPKVEEESRSE